MFIIIYIIILCEKLLNKSGITDINYNYIIIYVRNNDMFTHLLFKPLEILVALLPNNLQYNFKAI